MISKIAHLSSKVTASYSDIYIAFKSMDQSVITRIEKLG